MNQHLLATLLLVLGAATGVIMAAAGLLQTAGGLPDDAVARVNHVTLSQSRFDQYVDLINSVSRTDKDREYILERMIEEELLVQRGLELGMVNLNSTVRNAIVQAVTSRFRDSDTQVPDQTSLAEFYEAHRGYFTPASQYQVEVITPPDFPLPITPLTQKSLIEYLGPDLTERVLSLDPGETSTKIESNDTVFQFRMLTRTIGEAPPLQAIRASVIREYQRQQNQAAFDDYIRWLRDRADVDIKHAAIR
ncbi:MAG: hypothetical protein WD558_09395 [Pseudomonadales bacterium]